MVLCPSASHNLDEGRSLGFPVCCVSPQVLLFPQPTLLVEERFQELVVYKSEISSSIVQKEKKEINIVTTWHLRSKRERERVFSPAEIFTFGEGLRGLRAFLGMGGEALGNLILLHSSSLV